MYKYVWPYSRCVYIPVTGIPSSGTRATTLTPFGSCTVGEFTAIAGNTFNKLDCAEAGKVSEVQSMRAAILAIRSPKAANIRVFMVISLSWERSGARNADKVKD